MTWRQIVRCWRTCKFVLVQTVISPLHCTIVLFKVGEGLFVRLAYTDHGESFNVEKVAKLVHITNTYARVTRRRSFES